MVPGSICLQVYTHTGMLRLNNHKITSFIPHFLCSFPLKLPSLSQCLTCFSLQENDKTAMTVYQKLHISIMWGGGAHKCSPVSDSSVDIPFGDTPIEEELFFASLSTFSASLSALYLSHARKLCDGILSDFPVLTF